MQLFQGRLYRWVDDYCFCLLLAFGLAATLSWVTPDTNAIHQQDSLGGHVTDQNALVSQYHNNA